jgi:hypothetical protein
MANTFAPQGFLQTQGTGVTPSFELTQMAVSSSNTGAIFSGDPVMQAAGTTGLATGYITQGYAPVPVVISAIAFTATTFANTTFTITAITSGVPTSPNAWAPPVGSVLSIGAGSYFATGGSFQGNFTVNSSTTTTIVATSGLGTTTGSTTYTGTYNAGTSYVYVPVVGVFDGCKYLSTSQKRVVWSNYYPGSDANTAAAVTANVINDPLAQFTVQTGNSNTTATAVGITNIGLNATFNYSQSGASPATVNGNTANGLSTMFLDQYLIGNSEFLPFKILSLPGYSPDGNNPFSTTQNNDYTAAYGNVIAGFNNMQLKQLRGV